VFDLVHTFRQGFARGANQFLRDESSLEQIKGMGPHKVKMYGEALLSAVRGANGASD
jgi:hypothetical protein